MIHYDKIYFIAQMVHILYIDMDVDMYFIMAICLFFNGCVFFSHPLYISHMYSK